jgi:uncharacterized protein (DUF1499 family)
MILANQTEATMLKKIGTGVYITLGVIAFGAFCAGIIGGYFRILQPGPAFGLFVIGMLTGVVVTVVGLIDLAKNGVSGRSVLLVMGIIPVVALVYGAVSGREYPMINDVSTDLVRPPALTFAASQPENESRNMAFPLENNALIQEAYGDIELLAVMESIDETHVKALSVIEGLSTWEVTSNEISQREILIEGTVTSTVFGFVDDFAIRLAKTDSGTCVVDMRSKSRLGKGDFGQNAAHIRQFMELMKL